ncbi:unnamed protein product, partial [Didymodactylos carnosus]
DEENDENKDITVLPEVFSLTITPRNEFASEKLQHLQSNNFTPKNKLYVVSTDAKYSSIGKKKLFTPVRGEFDNLPKDRYFEQVQTITVDDIIPPTQEENDTEQVLIINRYGGNVIRIKPIKNEKVESILIPQTSNDSLSIDQISVITHEENDKPQWNDTSIPHEFYRNKLTTDHVQDSQADDTIIILPSQDENQSDKLTCSSSPVHFGYFNGELLSLLEKEMASNRWPFQPSAIMNTDDLIWSSNEQLSFSFPLKPQSTQINEPLQCSRPRSPTFNRTPQARRRNKENRRPLSMQKISTIEQQPCSTFLSLTNVTPLAKDVLFVLSSIDDELKSDAPRIQSQLRLSLEEDTNYTQSQKQQQTEQVQTSATQISEQQQSSPPIEINQYQAQSLNEDEVQEVLEALNRSSQTDHNDTADDQLGPIHVVFKTKRPFPAEHVPYPPPLISYSQAIREKDQQQHVRENTLTNTALKSLPRKPANYSFVLSGLTASQRNKVQNLVRKMGDCYLQTYVDLSTTHVIMNYEDDKPPEEQITMEIILAMLYGCPIVTVDWIVRSVKVGEWLSCKKYEILLKKVQSVKLYKKARQNGKPITLFQKCEDIYLTSTTKYPRDDLLRMIILSGGNTTVCRNRARVVVGKSSKLLKVIPYPNVKEEWVIAGIFCKSDIGVIMTSKDSAFIGIRLGASNISVAYYKDGRSETIVNELGDRSTPTFITYNDNDSVLGLPSKQGLTRNQQNTIIWSPHFIGCSERRNEEFLTCYKQTSPIDVTENDNRVTFSLTLNGKSKSVDLETVITAFFHYIKQLVLSATNLKEVQAVLSSQYNVIDDQDLIRICIKKSGIELKAIIPDACSACLAYELDKDSGHVESNVLIYRLGGSTYECSIIRSIGGCLKTLASQYGYEHSGDRFTDVVVNIIADEFQNDPRSVSRSLLKLRACAEQAKHILSTTPSTQCSVDALHDGIDLDSSISRLRFNGEANSLFLECMKPIDYVLEKAQLQADDIKLIVLCGGGTKILQIRDFIQQKLPNADMLSSINADEVIALGAARQCYIQNKYRNSKVSTSHGKRSSIQNGDDVTIDEFECVGVRYFRSHLDHTGEQNGEATASNKEEKEVLSDSDAEDDNDKDDEQDLDIDWTKHETYLRKLDVNDWKDQDHYKVLGLAKLRYKATQKQIRAAHKLMILRYHPDKSKRIESERFSLITHAFEILSNPQLRRAYDSVDPKFDDTIPGSTVSVDTQTFFDIFGPVFERNARWSNLHPVPLLGNIDSSFDYVNKFYCFWYEFDSWREYSYLDEEDKSQGQDRDERRYIEKANRVERVKRKKTEMQRIRSLVDNAYKNDMRIKKFKQDEQQRKDDEKLRKKTEVDKRRQEQKQRELDEQKRIQDEKQRQDDEVKRKQDELRKEKEIQKKFIKKEKKQLRDLCKEHNYFNEKENNLKQIEQIEYLIECLPLDQLKVLNEKLKEENCDKKQLILTEIQRIEEEKIQQKRAEDLQQQSTASASASSAVNGTLSKWSPDEIELLVKALRLYPAGVQNRWNVVLEFIKRGGGSQKRTVQDVMQKAKDIQSGKKELEEVVQSLDNITLRSHKNKQQQQHIIDEQQPSERDDAVLEQQQQAWTADEQRIFEQALRTYPNTLGPSRWDKIAECLPNRSKKECLERYKELARIVQAKKQSEAAATVK